MNIITVIPLSRAKVPPTLSYFTASDVPIGAVVSVPMRSKSIHAIVSGIRSAEDIKTEIRSADYEIRKLGKIRANAFFPASFMDACKLLADFYATNIGSIIHTLISDSLLESAGRIAPPLPLQSSFVSGIPAPSDTIAIQGDDADRLSAWKSLIRQEFARKRSIAFYAPTIEDAVQLYDSLEKGIGKYIYLLHGGLTKKKILEMWSNIADAEHPIVVVASGPFAILPRTDIETVVIERENGRGWMSQRMPYMDMRRAIETVARGSRRTVYLSDALLRVETLRRMDEREIAEGSPFKWRSISTAEGILIDMRRKLVRRSTNSDDTEDEQHVEFRVLSKELERLIEQNRDQSSHLFIMAIRRGLSPSTVCNDCENVILCKNCSAPVVLHASKATSTGKPGKNFYLCHKCGTRKSADEACPTCGGWRLSPLGVGIDKVVETIREDFPRIDLFKLDVDSSMTDREIAEVLKKFRAKPGSILVGTEAALLRLHESIDHVAIASLDSLFALPDFRMEEKIMYALVRLRSLASRSMLVQTRRADEKVFGYGLKGNLADFYRSTAGERKQFSYPPFSVLIKITLEGKKDQIARYMGEIQALVNPHEVEVFPAFTSTLRGASVIHGLIKIDPDRWPEADLLSKLRCLPPSVSIKVNPESLL